MEQRRNIGIGLIIVAGLLFLVSAVSVIIKMPWGSEKVSHIVVNLLPQLLVLAVTAYPILRRQNLSEPPALGGSFRQIRAASRRTYDPDGYHFIVAGGLCLFISISFSLFSLKAIGLNPFGNKLTSAAAIALCLLSFAGTMVAVVKSVQSIYRNYHKNH